MLQSLAEGFAIVGVMGVFGAFNSVVSHSELVQSTPRAFYEVGLVVVVGLAFVPSTLAAIHDVREADRARTGGRVVRRGRLLRQVVPVLELGLERAVTLAESMDARGFARAGASPRDRIAGWCGVASLLALGGAFVALDRGVRHGRRQCSAWRARAGSRRRSSSPRRARNGCGTGRVACARADWLMAGAVLLAPVAMATCSLAGDSSLVWFANPLRLAGPARCCPVARRCCPAARSRSVSGPRRRRSRHERDLVPGRVVRVSRPGARRAARRRPRGRTRRAPARGRRLGLGEEHAAARRERPRAPRERRPVRRRRRGVRSLDPLAPSARARRRRRLRRAGSRSRSSSSTTWSATSPSCSRTSASPRRRCAGGSRRCSTRSASRTCATATRRPSRAASGSAA